MNNYARVLMTAVIASAVLTTDICLAGAPRTISYQGILQHSTGEPADGVKSMAFALYDTSAAGAAIWEDTYSVEVQNGIFDANLGPIDLPFDVPYWLGVSVEGAPELAPRIPLHVTAYSLHASAIASNAITTAMFADSAVTQQKLGPDVSTPPEGAAGGDLGGFYPEPAVEAVRSRPVAPVTPAAGQVLRWDGASWIPESEPAVPQGMIFMWSGPLNQIPAGWGLCDGTNGTPNLSNRFLYGVASPEQPGAFGGSDFVPTHSHRAYVGAKTFSIYSTTPTRVADGGYWIMTNIMHNHSADAQYGTTNSAAGTQWIPKYYAVAFIMKL